MEIEHVDVPALEAAAQHLAMDVEPTPATLSLIQVTSGHLLCAEAGRHDLISLLQAFVKCRDASIFSPADQSLLARQAECVYCFRGF